MQVARFTRTSRERQRSTNAMVATNSCYRGLALRLASCSWNESEVITTIPDCEINKMDLVNVLIRIFKVLVFGATIVGVIIAAVVLVGGSYLNRPHHKYRLTVEVETPDGLKTASNVMMVYKDRLSIGGIGGASTLKGDAIFIDLGRDRNLIALLSHGSDGSNLSEMTQLASDAFAAAGKKSSLTTRQNFREP